MFQDCDAECLLETFGSLSRKEASALLSDAADGSFVLRNDAIREDGIIVTMKHPTRGIVHLGFYMIMAGTLIRTPQVKSTRL